MPRIALPADKPRTSTATTETYHRMAKPPGRFHGGMQSTRRKAQRLGFHFKFWRIVRRPRCALSGTPTVLFEFDADAFLSAHQVTRPPTSEIGPSRHIAVLREFGH